MIAELDAASDVLHTALDRYVAACATVRNNYVHGTIVNNVPPELTDCITNELLSALSYKATMQQAKSAISAARNCSSNTVPIVMLPTEVLTRIFRFVVGLQHCGSTAKRESVEPKGSLSKHPVYLSHVCLRWRQIVLNAPALWTHIDFSTTQLGNQRLATRNEVFMARAGRSLLDVHIVEPRPSRETSKSLVEFLAPIATRIGSLDITIYLKLIGHRGICTPILSSCLSNCVPGTLSQLSIQMGGSNDARGLLGSNENPIHHPDIQLDVLLDIPKQTLDDLWLYVAVLRLNGSYPYWASTAYQGLTELRLLGRCTIPEEQFVTILKSSPGLRVLEFDLEIVDPLPDDDEGIPVHLNDLELLITGLGLDSLNSFLRLLAPGSKPLQVSIWNPNDRKPVQPEPSSSDVDANIMQFFARSNVTKLWGVVLDEYTQAVRLLSLAPNLQTLVLEEFAGRRGDALNDMVLDVSLDALCLWRCILLDLDEVRQFVEKLKVQRLALWRCTFRGERSMIEQEELCEELSQFCPTVQLLPHNEPDPLGRRERLD